MINYTLSFQIPEFELKINHQEEIVLMGSCFSNEITNKLSFNGFNVHSNPFGTIFHPICLSNFITDSIQKEKEEKIFNRKDIFLSWDASSTIFDYSKNELSKKLKKSRVLFLNKLKKSKAIFITFGTAWGYRLKESKLLVANCHKMDQNLFNKELSEIDEIVKYWNNTIQLIKQINPDISIFFTISPVRHIKDGLIENNQSKAILIEAIRQINLNNSTSYFPSYEIIIDELRDYRFFKTDKIHPNEEAIDYIWSKFQETFLDEKTQKICHEIINLKRQLAHKHIHTDSEETKIAQRKLENRIKEFKTKYPSIIL